MDIFNQAIIEPDVAANTLKEPMNDSEVDMSEGVAFEMFGLSSFEDNEVKLRHSSYIVGLLVILTRRPFSKFLLHNTFASFSKM